jgi:hypothetical protein
MRKEDFTDASVPQKKKLNIGDKVRFLNNVGGGIVTAFHGKDQVLVEDENGFDVPVLIVECVVIGQADRRMECREPEPYVPPKKNAAPVDRKPVKESAIIPEPFKETPQGERLNVCLAFLPLEPKKFMQSPFESYLINESNYYLYVNYMSCKNNSRTSRFHGMIEPDTKIFIEEIEKSALDELAHICVQMIAFKEEGRPFSPKSALSVELRPDTVKFYKLHCFTKNDFFDEDALIMPLVTNDAPEKQMLVSATDLREAMYRSKKEERRTPPPPVKKTDSADSVLEVDLHIHQLIDNTSGMSNADMLNYQIDRFHEVMKANIGKKKGRKIVFIHGKGEGVLRAALEKELNTTYKHQSHFQDASFREYGFGATMVVIR